jgi:putative DNA primase/helicase
VAAFVRDLCVKGPHEQVLVDDIYKAFREWVEDNGHAKSTKQVFGRDLRAALGGRLKVAQLRDGDHRKRVYRGIGLRGAP